MSPGFWPRCWISVTGISNCVMGERRPSVTKICTKCKAEQPVTEYQRAGNGLRAQCRSCVRIASKAWRDANPDRHNASRRVGKLRGRYRMTVEQYEALLASQQGRCATCLKPPGGRLLAVDHDHATGLVRGLLCVFCNSKLVARHRGAHGAELFDRVARYLRNPPAQDIMRGHTVADTKPNGKKWDDE